MDCRHISQQIDAYWDRELPEPEASKVRVHLQECRACGEQYGALDAWLVSPVPVEPPIGLRDRIIAAMPSRASGGDVERYAGSDPPMLRIHSQRSPGAIRLIPLAWAGALAACIAVIVMSRPEIARHRGDLVAAAKPHEVSAVMTPDIATLPSLLFAAMRPDQLAVAGAAVAQAAALEQVAQTTAQVPLPLQAQRRPLREDYVPLAPSQNMEPIPAVIGAMRTIGA